MLIVDGDYPMAIVAMRMRRDVSLPIADVRASESGDNVAMASLPELRRAGVMLATMKIAADGQRQGGTWRGPNPAHRAYAIGKGQVAYYRALEAQGEIRVIRTRDDLRRHVAAWEAAQADEAARGWLPVGAVLGLEGADAVVEPDQLGEWWDDGIRLISIGHYGVSPYGHGTGTGTQGGLLPSGPALLREMARLGIALDVTHTSDQSVRESLALFDGPLLATHSNVRALTPGERQLPDDLVRAVIHRDGVIGASMDVFMLHPTANPNWGQDVWPHPRSLFPREEVRLGVLVDHVEYVCRLAGDTGHAGIGGDTDGQGGRECSPLEIDTVADYLRIADILRDRSYGTSDVENIMWRNWVRLFDRILPA